MTIAGYFAEGNQARKKPTGGLLTGIIQFAVELVGPAGQGPPDAATGLISAQGERPPYPPLEQFGQGILEQGQRPRLVAQIPDDGFRQARF